MSVSSFSKLSALSTLLLVFLLTKAYHTSCFQIRWCNTIDDIHNSYAECYSNTNCVISYYPLNATDRLSDTTVTLTGFEGSRDLEPGKELCPQNNALQLKNSDWWTDMGVYIASHWSKYWTKHFSLYNFLEDTSNNGPYQVHAEIVRDFTSYTLDFVAENDDAILLRMDKPSGKIVAYRIARNTDIFLLDQAENFAENFKEMDTSCCFKFKQDLLESPYWKLEPIATSKPLIYSKLKITNIKQGDVTVTLKPHLADSISLLIGSSVEEEKTAEVTYNGEALEYISWTEPEEHKNTVLRDSKFTDLIITPLSWKSSPYDGVYKTETIWLVNTLNEPLDLSIVPKEDKEQRVFIGPKSMISVSYYGEGLEKLTQAQENNQDQEEAKNLLVDLEIQEPHANVFVFTKKDAVVAVIQEDSGNSSEENEESTQEIDCGYYCSDDTDTTAEFLQEDMGACGYYC